VNKFSEIYDLVVGLEVHVQLLTKSKIFAFDENVFSQNPNTTISPITLAHPGTLPRVNKHCVELAIRFGVAVGAEIASSLSFDRKNYFYPDLPKGYQLTQDKNPICKGGKLEVPTTNGSIIVELNRAHLEEDAGKSIHDQNDSYTLVDLNRAGVPLLEIVTDPVISTAEHAAAFLTELRRLVRFIGVSDGNMQEGSIRCDANISVRLKGSNLLGNRCEIKNLNSMRFLQKAIEFEFERQCEILEKGGAVAQETRGFNAANGTTYSLRSKELAHDYRYFPDPDLQPMRISADWVEIIRAQLPELPLQRTRRFEKEMELSVSDASLLTQDIDTASFFEQAVSLGGNPKVISNWMNGPIRSWLNSNQVDIANFCLSPGTLVAMLESVEKGFVSHSVAVDRLLPLLLEHPEKKVIDVIQEFQLTQSSNESDISRIAAAVLNDWPQKVEAYKKGNKALLGLFMGEMMKKSNGKINPHLASSVLQELLSK
jgi:aspartyl-tRNA(Asn)/glutamyl-tRNA(Gln) amidotransferase subunit B